MNKALKHNKNKIKSMWVIFPGFTLSWKFFFFLWDSKDKSSPLKQSGPPQKKKMLYNKLFILVFIQHSHQTSPTNIIKSLLIP